MCTQLGYDDMNFTKYSTLKKYLNKLKEIKI